MSERRNKGMGKMKSKKDLPQKMCPVCRRPFAWRKKWERDWVNVIYCSKRCQNERNKSEHDKSQHDKSERKKPQT